MISGIISLCLLTICSSADPTTMPQSSQNAVCHVVFQDSNPLLDEGEVVVEDGLVESAASDSAQSSEAEGGIPGLSDATDERDEPTRLPEVPSSKPGQAIVGDQLPTVDPGESVITDEPPILKETPLDTNQPGYEPIYWTDGLYWDGWLDQGVTVNTLSPRDRTNGPVTFNDRSNDYQLNQMYLRLRRDVDLASDYWQIGGSVDLLYGTDSFYTSARGLEVFDDYGAKWNAQRYGLSMPQAYMEAFAPWGQGLTMKLGHFYSLFGYETVTAPDNFFYSHSYVFQYGEPFTYTGLLGTTKFGDLNIQAGMTRGWDNWEDNNNDLGFFGGVAWTSRNGRTNIAMNVQAAREQPDPSSNIRTLYSLVIQQRLGEFWQYVIQHDFGTEPDAGIGGTVANWYGVNQYLFRSLGETWKAGMRFEWFRDEGGSHVPRSGQTADYYELSVGLNWTPNRRIMLRPELRWDWTGTPDYYPFGDGTRSNQLLLDCDLIVRY